MSAEQGLESRPTDAPIPSDDVEPAPAEPWQYRARRKHLYGRARLQAVKAAGGGPLAAMCGVVVQISGGNPGKVAARHPGEPMRHDDCPTCLDIWHRRDVVRL